MKSVVDELEVADDRVRVGAVTYSDGSYIQFQLNTYDRKDDVLQVILPTVPIFKKKILKTEKDNSLHFQTTFSIGKCCIAVMTCRHVGGWWSGTIGYKRDKTNKLTSN